MKFFLYVAVAALVSSAQCLVIRNVDRDSSGSSSEELSGDPVPVGHSSGEVHVVESVPVLHSSGEVHAVNSLPVLPSSGEVHILPSLPILSSSENSEENGILGLHSLELLGHSDYANQLSKELTKLLHRFGIHLPAVVPGVGKGHCAPGHSEGHPGKGVSKRNVANLFPVAGDMFGGMIHTAEDVVGSMIPKLGKRDIPNISGLFPASGGGAIDNLVNKGQELVTAWIPKSKRNVESALPIGALNGLIPKFGKRDIANLFPIGGGMVSGIVNPVEDMFGLIVPKFGKIQKRELITDGIEAVNDNLFKPAMQTGVNMGNRFVKVLLQPISD